VSPVQRQLQTAHCRVAHGVWSDRRSGPISATQRKLFKQRKKRLPKINEEKMIGCNRCLSSFCPPTAVYINIITFTSCAFTASYLFPTGPLSTSFSTFHLPWQFFPPLLTPFIYLKFPSNVFFAFLIQSSKFHYHFLSIILPYLFSSFALPLPPHVRRLSNISTFLPSSFSLYS